MNPKTSIIMNIRENNSNSSERTDLKPVDEHKKHERTGIVCYDLDWAEELETSTISSIKLAPSFKLYWVIRMDGKEYSVTMAELRILVALDKGISTDHGLRLLTDVKDPARHISRLRKKGICIGGKTCSTNSLGHKCKHYFFGPEE